MKTTCRVPDHPDYPESKQQLLAYAAADLDCSFVLFDSDGDVLEGFAIPASAHERPGPANGGGP
jgi:hypothetical protein